MQQIYIGYDCDTVYVNVGGKQFSGGRDGINEHAELMADVLRELGYRPEVEEIV